MCPPEVVLVADCQNVLSCRFVPQVLPRERETTNWIFSFTSSYRRKRKVMNWIERAFMRGAGMRLGGYNDAVGIG
jgi:hypothetical protein